MDELLEILSEVKPDVDFATETGLIENGILDSFDIVQIVTALKEKFEIRITPADVIPDNFNSAQALWEMVQRLQ